MSEKNNKNILYCSFCGKSQHEVRKLIAGPTHSSQIKTVGPAISFLTSCWLFPQKEQYKIFLLFFSDITNQYD